MCRSCIRNALLEYEYEFTCSVCGFNILKTKNQFKKFKEKRLLLLKVG